MAVQSQRTIVDAAAAVEKTVPGGVVCFDGLRAEWDFFGADVIVVIVGRLRGDMRLDVPSMP